MLVKGNIGQMVFNKNRLLQNCNRLLHKFKRKCLPDIIVFKSRKHHEVLLDPMSDRGGIVRDNAQAFLRQAKQKETLSNIFKSMHEYNEVSLEPLGVEVSMNLLLEAALLEFEETNTVTSTSAVLHQMFMQIKYLDMEYKDLQTYIKLLSTNLNKIAKEQTSFRVNGEAFRVEFVRNI